MKKFILSIALGALLVGLPSCSGDGKPLSASSAKSALKKEAIFAKDSQVKTFDIGFQEVSEESLNSLAQLKAAGVIDFTVETAKEISQSREYNYWSGYYYVTQEVEHFFADVQLTEEGRKLVVEEPTTVRSDLKDDLLANKDYEEKIPDYMSAYYSKPSEVSEPETVEPVVEEAIVEEDYADSTAVVVEAVEVEEIPAPEEPKASTPSKKNPNEAYEALIARINTETVNVLLGRYELVKVKDILCTEDMFKAGKGSCIVFAKFVEKTPFGFVLGAPSEGYIHSTKVTFVHYQDSGWVAENIE